MMKVIRSWKEIDKEITKNCPSASELVTKKIISVSVNELGFKNLDSFLGVFKKESLKLMLETNLSEENYEVCEKIKNRLNKF